MALLRCRTLCFYDHFDQHVSNTLCFSGGFHEYGLAAVQWIAAPAADFSRKACKNLGSGNMRKKKHVKTQGSAPGTLQNLVFYSTFLSVSKTPMDFSRFICFLGAVLGPPLSRPQNRRFHTKTLIARSLFQRPDQIEIRGGLSTV